MPALPDGSMKDADWIGVRKVRTPQGSMPRESAGARAPKRRVTESVAENIPPSFALGASEGGPSRSREKGSARRSLGEGG